jgi:hypothetical protein
MPKGEQEKPQRKRARSAATGGSGVPLVSIAGRFPLLAVVG